MKWLALVLLLAGCGAGVGTISAIAPVAVQALRAIASQQGVSLNESGAACFPLDDLQEFDDVPVVAVVCIAPKTE